MSTNPGNLKKESAIVAILPSHVGEQVIVSPDFLSCWGYQVILSSVCCLSWVNLNYSVYCAVNARNDDLRIFYQNDCTKYGGTKTHTASYPPRMTIQMAAKPVVLHSGGKGTHIPF